MLRFKSSHGVLNPQQQRNVWMKLGLQQKLQESNAETTENTVTAMQLITMMLTTTLKISTRNNPPVEKSLGWHNAITEAAGRWCWK